MKKLFLFALMAVLILKANSQNNVSASLGMGIPELYNLGIRYELHQTRLGLSIGTVFTGAFALSGDVYYHFGNRSRISGIPPWYIRGNLTWWEFDKILFIDLGEAVLLGFRIGRDFNINRNVGISIDGGIIAFSFLSGRKVPFAFIPSASISFYYRLWEW